MYLSRDKLPDGERKRARREAIPNLAKRINRYGPRVVVALLKKVERDVCDALNRSPEYTSYFIIRFLDFGQRCWFERDIQEQIAVLKKAVRKRKY